MHILGIDLLDQYTAQNTYSYNNTPILYDIKHIIDKSYFIV